MMITKDEGTGKGNLEGGQKRILEPIYDWL